MGAPTHERNPGAALSACTRMDCGERIKGMKTKPFLIAACLAALACGAAACSSTPDDVGTGAAGSGAATEGSTYGNDARSVSVGGTGLGPSGNSGGISSTIGSH